MKICTKCGARMSDSNRFCEKCGSTLVTETAAGHTAVPVRSETSLSLVGWLQKYGRHIMRVAALLAVVLFFCPLFLVSCEGVQMNVSGFQTATGFGFDDDGNTKSSWFLSEEDNSRYYTQDNASLPQGSLTAFAAQHLCACTERLQNRAEKCARGADRSGGRPCGRAVLYL